MMGSLNNERSLDETTPIFDIPVTVTYKENKYTRKMRVTQDSIVQDSLIQIRSALLSREITVDDELDNTLKNVVNNIVSFKLKYVIKKTSIVGFNLYNQSLSRIFCTRNLYIDFIMDITLFCLYSRNIWLLVESDQGLVEIFNSFINHREPENFGIAILGTTVSTVIHGNTILTYFTSQFRKDALAKVFIRILNYNFDMMDAFGLSIFTQEEYRILRYYYRLTFKSHDHYEEAGNPWDFLEFITRNITQITIITHFLGDVREDFRMRTPPSFEQCFIQYFNFLYNYITGGEQFLRSGGESNPGPMATEFMRRVTEYLFGQQVRQMTNAVEEAKDLATMSLHLMRLFTSISDALGSFMTGRAIAPIDFTTRIASLALNIYESHKAFGLEFGFRMRPRVHAQGGPMESTLISAILAYGTPPFIRELLKDMPKFTNVKILDDATWFYDLFGFLISIPRRILSLFEDEEKEGIISILTAFLLGIEDLFPFSSLCRVKNEMESIIKIHTEDPSVMLQESFHDRVLKLDVKRKSVESIYQTHKRSFPNYYAGTSEQYDNLVIDILKYRSDVRVEPVCIVFHGPKGTGKTVLMNLVNQMYKNAGMRSFQDNIPASVENKKFYDSYNNEEIYIVDDIGAKAYAQWSEIVNQVSSAKYPLEAAKINNKNTKFFNSQLMLLSCNVIPSSFKPGDGVADIEAFYRRLKVFNFKNVTFIDGQYAGSIAVEIYDSTLGVKKFIERAKFTAVNGQFDLKEIDSYISKELRIKTEHYLANKRMAETTIGTPFPKAQGLIDSLCDSFNNALDNMPCIDALMGQVYELIAQTYDSLKENKQFAGACKMISDHSTFLLFLGLGTLSAGAAIYYTMKEKVGRDKNIDIIQKHYSSNRTQPGNFKKMIAQGFVDMQGQITPSIPQLIPFQRNVAALTFNFQNTRGQHKRTKARGLFSQDKLLTIYHIFGDLDVNKPIYVTARIGDNILYDYMELSIVAYSSYADWIIFRIPETAPTFFKKITRATQYNSTQLYLATGQDIIDLGSDVTQYSFGVGYEYGETYKGTLTPKDIMYNIEGDGLCGSLLLTKEGCILGMHTAAVSFDDKNGKEKIKGITKIFDNATYDFITGVLGLDMKSKVNLDYEIKNRQISGVYINNADKCYGLNGTKYIESPIYGVFPTWRKPALLLPEEKQNYKELTEAMMKPAGDVNLSALEFSEEILNNAITNDTFPPLDETEIVKGNGLLNRIDPSTSPGHSMKFSTKEKYLDYENGNFKEDLVSELKNYIDPMAKGEYKFDDCATITSKDELKDVEDITDPNSMPKKIRIFTNYHLMSTILFRYFFGNLLGYVMLNKFTNGIMIGINPLSEQWDKFAKILTMRGRECFDGDYKNYDKNMHPAFQRRLNHWLIARTRIDANHFNKTFKTQYTHQQVDRILRQVLECIISTPILSKNKKFITTHGLPSGTALTAFYNSCINMMYSSYVYRMTAPFEYLSVHHYLSNTNLFFYGDDIIGNVTEQVKPFFNPSSFSTILQPLGLDFTPADKGEWTDSNQFKDLTQCTFLKRKFYLHPKVGNMVAPLDHKSMEGTMNYITDKYRSVSLTLEKCANFQRECFLHPPSIYEEKMNILLTKCAMKGLRFKPLSEEYLLNLYRSGEYGDLLQLN